MGYRKILCIIGVSCFSGESFWSHGAEKFHGHPLNNSENLGYRKILCIIGVSCFSGENFWSHSAEKFHGHPFNVSETLGRRNFLCIIWGILFFVEIFCLTVPKNLVNEPFSVSLISGIKKFEAYEGSFTFFSRKFVVPQYRKISWGNPSVLYFRKFQVAEKFMEKRGGIKFFRQLFCLTVPKNFVKEPFSVSLFSGIEKC